MNQKMADCLFYDGKTSQTSEIYIDMRLIMCISFRFGFLCFVSLENVVEKTSFNSIRNAHKRNDKRSNLYLFKDNRRVDFIIEFNSLMKLMFYSKFPSPSLLANRNE